MLCGSRSASLAMRAAHAARAGAAPRLAVEACARRTSRRRRGTCALERAARMLGLQRTRARPPRARATAGTCSTSRRTRWTRDVSLPIAVTMTQEQARQAKPRSLIKRFKMGGTEPERRREKFRQMTMNRIIVGPNVANSVQKTNSAKGSRKLSEFAGEGSEEGGIGAAEFDEKNSRASPSPRVGSTRRGNPIESDAARAAGPGVHGLGVGEDRGEHVLHQLHPVRDPVVFDHARMETPTFPAEGSNAATAFLAIDITFGRSSSRSRWCCSGWRSASATAQAARQPTGFHHRLHRVALADPRVVRRRTPTPSPLQVCACSASFAPSAQCGAAPDRMVVDCTLNALPAIKWIMVLGMFLRHDPRPITVRDAVLRREALELQVPSRASMWLGVWRFFGRGELRRRGGRLRRPDADDEARTKPRPRSSASRTRARWFPSPSPSA